MRRSPPGTIPDVIVLTLVLSPDGTTLGVSTQTSEGIVFEEMATGPTHAVAPVGDHLLTEHNGAEIRHWIWIRRISVDVATNPRRFAMAIPMADDTTVMYSDANALDSSPKETARCYTATEWAGPTTGASLVSAP